MPKFKYKNSMPKVVKEYIHDLMTSNKIESVDISFSGSGDDGSINNVSIYPENISLVGSDIVSVPKEVIESMQTLDHSNSFAPSMPLEDVFVKIVEYWIYEVPVDWVNGEGGEGSCSFVINKNKLTIEVSAHEWILENGPTYKSVL